MNTAPVERLHLFFATETPRALILRRVARRLYQLIGWDRDTDAFTPGQWLKKEIQIDACRLSPDGQHFLYVVTGAPYRTEATDRYTVISRPPYFTALALFPQGDFWQLGGVFLDSRTYWIAGDHATHDIIGRDDDLERVFQGEPGKGCTTGLRRVNGTPVELTPQTRRRLLGGGALDAPRSGAGDGYDTQGGKLYRRAGMDLTPMGDFSDLAFETVIAPYDTRTRSAPDAPADWHPLDGEGT
ncbi:MAG: hypothetical protein AAGF74_15130 [Pseudomonadota bacterium]